MCSSTPKFRPLLSPNLLDEAYEATPGQLTAPNSIMPSPKDTLFSSSWQLKLISFWDPSLYPKWLERRVGPLLLNLGLVIWILQKQSENWTLSAPPRSFLQSNLTPMALPKLCGTYTCFPVGSRKADSG